MVKASAVSKTLSHALRHAPWVYALELDAEGWTPVAAVIAALREHRAAFAALDRTALEQAVAEAGEGRFEIDGARMRARYGHSTPGKLPRSAAAPPAALFHAAPPEVATLILAEGLKPMRRQYVHLSVEPALALSVGRRKGPGPRLLQVAAAEAHGAGVAFYEGDQRVWLADQVPPGFIALALEASG